MAYKLAEEDKLCGVIYPTYEGFSPIPKATCEMLESKCEQTIVVKCGESSEEDKKPESQSGSASASESTSESQASTSESTSESTSTESTSESTSTESTSTSESTSASESTSTSESTSAESVSTSESNTTSTSESTSDSTSSSESTSTSESNSVSESTSISVSTSESTTTSTSTSEPLSESELASTSLKELTSEEFVAHSNNADEIRNNLETVNEILNGGLYDRVITVTRGETYTPEDLKKFVEDIIKDTSYQVTGDEDYTKLFTINKVVIDPKYKMDKDHEPTKVPLIIDISLPWGGKRTQVEPVGVNYVDPTPEPQPEPVPTPMLTNEELDTIVTNKLSTDGPLGKYFADSRNKIVTFALPTPEEIEAYKKVITDKVADVPELRGYTVEVSVDRISNEAPKLGSDATSAPLYTKVVKITKPNGDIYQSEPMSIFTTTTTITHPESIDTL